MQANQITEEIRRGWEDAFPDRIHSWYLLGSHAHNCATVGSDIDLIFLFRDPETLDDQLLAEKILRETQSRFSCKIDIWGLTLVELKALGKEPGPNLLHSVSLKFGSRLLDGADLRGAIVEPTIENYVDSLSTGAHGFMEKMSNLNKKTNREQWVKALVSSALFAASVLAARNSGKYIPKKILVSSHYRQYVGGEFVSFIELLTEKVWQKHAYSIADADFLNQIEVGFWRFFHYYLGGFI